MAAPSVARALGRPRLSGLAWRRARWGYVFIAPWLIGFVLFTAFPMIATLAFSFTNINLAQTEPLRFVGLKNYETLLADRQAWASLLVTLKFALLALPLAICLPLAMSIRNRPQEMGLLVDCVPFAPRQTARPLPRPPWKD